MRRLSLRSISFRGQVCQGFQVHVTDPSACNPWELGQWLLHSLFRELGPAFAWRQPPFEYVDDILPIDLLNGNAQLRDWVETQGALDELLPINTRAIPNLWAGVRRCCFMPRRYLKTARILLDPSLGLPPTPSKS
ncbi:MAG: DUF1343 domain-containing protein [Haliscomenobacter sp.]|nr:DUF1343 domain-containing protein [Haliscomenobacter sp.]